MKIFLKVNFAVLVSLIISASAFAQSNAQIEKELVAGIKEIKTNGNYSGNPDEDKLTKAQNGFQEKLLKYTKNASTLSYKFGALGEEIYIVTSDDGRFRIYSWDTEDGGTMHNFARVYQYRAADGKVYSNAEPDGENAGGGSFVTDIFTLDTKNGAVYIVCSTFIGSTKDAGQSADLYKIAGNALDYQVKLIKTKSGLTSTLNFGYNFFSVVDRPERPIRLIYFDKKTDTLKIPVVIEDKQFPDGHVTKKFISYRFDGNYFIKVS